jgi:WD40 repeat protein
MFDRYETIALGLGLQPITSVAWSHDGRYIAVGSRDDSIYIWDASARELSARYTCGQPAQSREVQAVAWSPDDRLVACSSGIGSVLGWNRHIPHVEGTWTLPVWIFEPHPDVVLDLGWSPDGKRFATCARDGTVRLWDGGPLLPEDPAAPPEGKPFFPGFGDWLALNLRWRGPLLEMGVCYGPPIRSFAWSPTGRELAFGQGFAVAVWDVDAARSRRSYSAHEAPVRTLVWEPSGARIASADEGGGVHIWEAASGETLGTFAAPYAIRALSWAPDGSALAVAGSRHSEGGGGVFIWDGQQPADPLAIHSPVGVVRALSWSPDGTCIAFGDRSDLLFWYAA